MIELTIYTLIEGVKGLIIKLLQFYLNVNKNE